MSPSPSPCLTHRSQRAFASLQRGPVPSAAASALQVRAVRCCHRRGAGRHVRRGSWRGGAASPRSLRAPPSQPASLRCGPNLSNTSLKLLELITRPRAPLRHAPRRGERRAGRGGDPWHGEGCRVAGEGLIAARLARHGRWSRLVQAGFLIFSLARFTPTSTPSRSAGSHPRATLTLPGGARTAGRLRVGRRAADPPSQCQHSGKALLTNTSRYEIEFSSLLSRYPRGGRRVGCGVERLPATRCRPGQAEAG